MERTALVLIIGLLTLWNRSGYAQAGVGESRRAGSTATAPIRGQANQAGGEAYRVTGRVLDDRTGKPVGGATVSLERMGMRCTLCGVRPPEPKRTTTTGADGEFAFDGVPSGKIFVSATRDGYVPALHHRIGVESWGETQLTNDWSQELHLVPAASISGMVRDHAGGLAGKDATNGTIALFEVSYWGGLPETSYTSVMPTFEADGTYHFNDLEPGRYFMVVSPGWDKEEPEGTRHNRPVGEVPLRYPKPSAGNPTPFFTLGEGEQKKISLQIPEKTLHHVSVTDGPTFGFELSSPSGGVFRVQQDQREKDAYFAWLPDGSYWLTSGNPGDVDGPVVFRVAGADVSGLHIKSAAWDTTRLPATVEVSIDGSPDLHCLPSDASECDLGNLELLNLAAGGTSSDAGDLRLTASTKAIATTLLPGRYGAVVAARKNLYVRSIRSGAFDLSRGPLLIRPGQAPAPIEAELAPAATIDGVVERDRKPVVAYVYALATGRTARGNFRFFAPVKTRDDGTFEMEGLAPGAWIVFASDVGNLQLDVRRRAETGYWRRHGIRVHAETGRTDRVVVKEARTPQG